MASNYPGAADSFDTIAADKKMSDAVGGRTHRAILNDLGDAIEAVQGELGTDPSGSAATVAARLSAIEAGTRMGTGSIGATQLADNAVDTAAIADGAVTPEKLSTEVGAATLEVGTVTTGTADVNISGNVEDGYQLDFVLPAVAGITIDEANANAMIAGGVGNTINKVASRATDPMSAHVEGHSTEAQGWYGHAEGAGSLAEGKISHAEGNNTICAANDSHAEGNMTVAGRRMYPVESTGSEDAGDSLGVLQYVLLPAVEGDVTSYFPNPLTDDVTGRYGAGTQLDAKGNVYESGMTPAVWSGDTPTTVNDLQWAMHSVAMLRAAQEYKPVFVSIAKAVYAGGKTKVYYLGAKPFTNIEFVYSAYAPGVLEGRNGQHAEGYKTSTWGYGAHAEGFQTRAWARGAHSEGWTSQATGRYSHAEGTATKASGEASHAAGVATEAEGARSSATGYESKATRDNQESYSVGKRVAVGDSQVSRIGSGKSCVNAGWHEIYVMNDMVDGRTYAFESMVIGRQTAGTAGTVGDSFAYKFQGAFTVAGGAMTVLGTISRTLIGRTAGMAGDGLSTGSRMTAMTSLYYDDLTLRFDGETDKTFYINVYSTVQELA